MTDGKNNPAVPYQPPSVVCIVLNWNGWRDTIPCLQSVFAQDYSALQVLVVDNASTDDSVDRIHEAFPPIEIVRSGDNNGFAAGNNIGIRLALERGAAFIWVLNNDTVAPPDTLTKLVAAAEDSNVAIVGSVLYYAHDPLQIQAWGGGSISRSTGFSRHFYSPNVLGPDSFLTFASVLLRREFLETVGLLDAGYFMYFEDADLCLRARSAGWQLAVAPDTAVLHKEGGSDAPEPSLRMQKIATASGMRFLSLHGKPKSVAPLFFALSRLGKRIARRDFAAAGAVWKGISDWRHNRRAALQGKT